MNFFKLIPSIWNTPDQNINRDLMVIDHYCVTRGHPRLFRKTVEDLIRRFFEEDKTNLIFRMQTQIGEVESIVSGVTKRIQIAGKIEKEDPSTHGRHEGHIKALKDGIDRLEAMQPVAPTLEETQRASEARKLAREVAIKDDADRFQIFLGVQLQAPSPQQQHVDIVYNMEDPDETAIQIRTPNPLFPAKAKPLGVTSGKAYFPDLWVEYRDEGRREHDHVEFLWELLRGKAKVTGRSLKFVERASSDGIWNKGPYIVALKVMSKEEKTLPVPLDITCLGMSCCDAGCANLKAHLMKLWSKSLVTLAVTIRDGDDVLAMAFDDGFFKPLTNDLCLHVE